MPPVDMLDVRVEVDGVDTWQIPKSAGPTDYPMRVQGPDVTLGWKISEADVGQWVLVIDDQVLPLSGSGSVREVVSSEEVSQLVLRQTYAFPPSYSLAGNYPNPFNPATTIRYELKDSGSVSLSIYDMSGQRIRQLVDEHQQAGYYELEWDGRDASGARVATGVYLYGLRAGDFRSVRKMVLMK